jgi:hypothetical protein
MYPPGGKLWSSHPSLLFISISLSLSIQSRSMVAHSRIYAGTFGGMIKGMFGFGGGKKAGSGKEEL